jgi:ribonuclease J
MNKKKNNKNNNKSKNQPELKFIPLGGMEDINRNCYVIEYGKDIVIVDMGLSFPDDDLHGVDYLIPDVEYLKKRKDRIRGLVLSHAHLDHIGAIPHVIEELGFPPIYGREFTIMYLEQKLKEYHLGNRVKLNKVEPKQRIKLGKLGARLVAVNHSIPQASSVVVDTPQGNIFYTGDYKFDEEPVKGPEADYEGLKEIGKEGVILGCFDSTNVYMGGKDKTETEVAAMLDKIVKHADGRVFAATFSSLGIRLYSLIKIARKYNKKVVVTGRSMREMISLLRKINYIQIKDNIFLHPKQAKDVPDNKLLVLTTGTQGEEMAALSRMARGEHRDFKIKSSDTIILSSSVIPGNQVPVQHLIDDLVQMDAKVIHQSFLDVHTSGHAYREDMKKMNKLIKPENIIPVHGWPSFRHEFAFHLDRWGVDRKNILLPDEGQTLIYEPDTKSWRKGKKLDLEDVFVEGGRVGETGYDVIEERAKLASYGVIFVILNLDNSYKVEGLPEILERGFLREQESPELFKEIREIARDIYYEWKNSKKKITKNEDFTGLYKKMRRKLERKIYKRTGKKPVVISQVVK